MTGLHSSAGWLPPALRDAPEGAGGPLSEPRLLDALLGAVDRQRQLLAADIETLWDDLFVESCADWVVPYVGALLGLPSDAERREVAYAVSLRRRKGTPGALEDFAEIVTGFTARVVEGWQVTVWAQRPGHPPPPRIASLSLRDLPRLRVGTAFEQARRSFTPGGRWSPRAATAVVWPWQVRTFRDTEPSPIKGVRYALHPLGAQAPLYLHPRPLRLASDADPAGDASRTGDETDAPVRSTYRVMRAFAGPSDIEFGRTWRLKATHPLAGAPGAVEAPLVRLSVGGTAIAWERLSFGSLPEGVEAPVPPAPDGAVVDVDRGHVELGAKLAKAIADAPDGGVKLRATWHRPVQGALGALASDADADAGARVVVTVNPAAPVTGPTVVRTLAEAFAQAEKLSSERRLAPEDSRPGRPDVEIRLATSDRLSAPAPTGSTSYLGFTPTLPRWRVVASRLATPIVVGDLGLDLEGAELTLEGFFLTGSLLLGPHLAEVRLRGLTMNPLVAGVAADADAWGLALSLERCILGPIRANLAGPLTITDCIVDGRGARLHLCGPDPAGAGDPWRPAVSANGGRFGPEVRARASTFAGSVQAEALDATDCLFIDGVQVAQDQDSCLRHCYLPDPGPDRSVPDTCGPFPAPTFVSVGFQAAGYYALALEPDHPLLSAASDGGEVGAYHHAGRAARLERLRRRIHEFVPLGLHAGVALAPWEE